MLRSILVAFAVASVPVTTTSAQVLLKPQITENSKSRTTIEVTSDQTLTLAGMPLETKVRQFMITNDATGKKQADGKYIVNGSFEVMQVEMQLPGGIELTFDSGNPKTEAAIPQLTPVLQLFDAISSSKYQTTWSEPGKIDGIEIRGNKYEALEDGLKKEFSPERMKQEAEQGLKRLPAEPVKTGDTWDRTEIANLGSGQTFELTRTFEYLGTKSEGDREFDRIGVKTNTVTYSVEPNPALPLELKKSDLKVTASNGELLFDRKLGAFVRTTESITIEGNLTLLANGNELPGELKLTITSRTSRE